MLVNSDHVIDTPHCNLSSLFFLSSDGTTVQKVTICEMFIGCN